MKRLTNTILFTFILHLAFGQIGINTENPLTLFHVDGARDNSASPSTAQISNDIAITTGGNIGAGTLTPVAKLDISNTGATRPLRIVDGSVMPNKVLESDADGVASWTLQPPSYTKTYRASTFGQQFFYNVRTLMPLNEEIVIPQPGKYLLTLQWWGYNRLDAVGHILSGYVYVRIKNAATDLDQIEYYMVGTVGDVLTFTTSLYLGDRLTGDRIEVIIKSTIGANSVSDVGKVQWELINDASRGDLMPKVIVYSI